MRNGGDRRWNSRGLRRRRLRAHGGGEPARNDNLLTQANGCRCGNMVRPHDGRRRYAVSPCDAIDGVARTNRDGRYALGAPIRSRHRMPRRTGKRAGRARPRAHLRPLGRVILAGWRIIWPARGVTRRRRVTRRLRWVLRPSGSIVGPARRGIAWRLWRILWSLRRILSPDIPGRVLGSPWRVIEAGPRIIARRIVGRPRGIIWAAGTVVGSVRRVISPPWGIVA